MPSQARIVTIPEALRVAEDFSSGFWNVFMRHFPIRSALHATMIFILLLNNWAATRPTSWNPRWVPHELRDAFWTIWIAIGRDGDLLEELEHVIDRFNNILLNGIHLGTLVAVEGFETVLQDYRAGIVGVFSDQCARGRRWQISRLVRDAIDWVLEADASQNRRRVAPGWILCRPNSPGSSRENPIDVDEQL